MFLPGRVRPRTQTYNRSIEPNGIRFLDSFRSSGFPTGDPDRHVLQGLEETGSRRNRRLHTLDFIEGVRSFYWTSHLSR